jgi:hypothetical protein
LAARRKSMQQAFVHCWLADRGRRVCSRARCPSGQPVSSFFPTQCIGNCTG